MFRSFDKESWRTLSRIFRAGGKSKTGPGPHHFYPNEIGKVDISAYY